MRERMVDNLGFIVPNVRVIDVPWLKDNEYKIFIRGNEVASSKVYHDRVVVYDYEPKTEDLHFFKNEKDPLGSKDVFWIKPEDSSQFEIQTFTPEEYIIRHLEYILIKNVSQIITYEDVVKIVEQVKIQSPNLIKEVVPNILSYDKLREILVNLIREKVSIKDIVFIIERLGTLSRNSQDPEILSERLRAELSRQICLTHTDEQKIMYAVTISTNWEKILEESCQRTELGAIFLLNPYQIKEFIDSVAKSLYEVKLNLGKLPVILSTPRIRLPLFKLLERHIPGIVIISYSDLIPEIYVKQLGTIELLDKAN